MTKYLLNASYTAEGARGLRKEGACRRQEVVASMIEGLGGRLEAFYYCLGDTDGIAIVDLPDDVSAAAVGTAIGATGTVRVATTVLLTAEQMDQAVKKPVKYQAPGG